MSAIPRVSGWMTIFFFPFVSPRLCSIRTRPWVLLRRTSSARTLCSFCTAPCRSLRARLSFRKRWPSSRSSTVSRSSWFNHVDRSTGTTWRRRRWWSLGGLSSMSQQQLTVACVAILSSKEVRGEKMGLCMITVLPLVPSCCVDVLLPNVSSYIRVCVCLHRSTVAGQEDCWLLTETLIQTATLQLKVCLNVQCLALHSFTDLHPGKRHHKWWSLIVLASSWFVVLHRVPSDLFRISQIKCSYFWKFWVSPPFHDFQKYTDCFMVEASANTNVLLRLYIIYIQYFIGLSRWDTTTMNYVSEVRFQSKVLDPFFPHIPTLVLAFIRNMFSKCLLVFV